MHITVNAQVQCTDGDCGRVMYVIIDPASRQLTHLVVKEKRAPHTERLVPMKWAVNATQDVIHLSCDVEQLANQDAFIETEFLREPLPDYKDWVLNYFLWPDHVPEVTKTVRVTYHNVPAGEFAVKHGARVEATDGAIGRVDEFLVDPVDRHITHLILREGHLWREKEIAIPITDIDRIEQDVVHLKLDKQSVGALPVIPVEH